MEPVGLHCGWRMGRWRVGVSGPVLHCGWESGKKASRVLCCGQRVGGRRVGVSVPVLRCGPREP